MGLRLGNKQIINKPFFDKYHQIHKYFPHPEWAIKIPVILLVGGVTLIFAFISNVLRNAAKKNSKKNA
jgi:hypothetical protein